MDIRTRRAEELEALGAFYGDDFLTSTRSTASTCSSKDYDNILDGPWFIQIRHAQHNLEYDKGTDDRKNVGIPTLEIKLPDNYPFGNTSPEPILHNIMMNPESKRMFILELKQMYEANLEIGIMWGERCREEFSSSHYIDEASEKVREITTGRELTVDSCKNDSNVRTFIPSSTKFSQPIRQFPSAVISNPGYKRDIIHTPPFHPPKSGSSETMIAHVCSVHCMEHIQWVLGELLFNDKKVSKASHNMFAFKFSKSGTLVSDNDDDGEKGSGAKLASLLQLSRVDNVLVVVSRWFGGVHLGPARFKHIAAVARVGLVQAGFLCD